MFSAIPILLAHKDKRRPTAFLLLRRFDVGAAEMQKNNTSFCLPLPVLSHSIASVPFFFCHGICSLPLICSPFLSFTFSFHFWTIVLQQYRVIGCWSMYAIKYLNTLRAAVYSRRRATVCQSAACTSYCVWHLIKMTTTAAAAKQGRKTG